MTLQELLNSLEVSRERLVHFEHPEISDETFVADLQLEWVDGEGRLYRINDPKREHLYAFTTEPIFIILEAETAEKASKHLLVVMERASELAIARSPKTLLKAQSQIRWKKRFHLLKMFAAVFLLLVGLSFLNEVWHRRSADPFGVVVGATLASVGFVLLWSEWKK